MKGRYFSAMCTAIAASLMAFCTGMYLVMESYGMAVFMAFFWAFQLVMVWLNLLAAQGAAK